MSPARNDIVHHVDEVLRSIFRRPRMWGSNEAIELQVLQLLQVRSVAVRPELERRAPRTVLNAYHGLLAREFPGAPPIYLHALTRTSSRGDDFIPLLQKLTTEILEGMQPEDVFAAHDLVLRLWLSTSIPRASALSVYYEALRRVLLALARGRGTRGLASREIEESLDFSMPDVSVTPANGAPPRIDLPLDQIERDPTGGVERALGQLVIVSEWAEGRGAVEELERRLEDRALPQKIAAQVLRLMPSEEASVRTVELGGRLLGPQRAVTLRPHQAQRMVEVVKHNLAPVPFDEMGDIRAVDMDQGSLRLTTTRGRFRCWVEDQGLLEAARDALGSRARVTGWLYRPPGNPLVAVERLSP